MSDFFSYLIKQRLYNLSAYFRRQLVGSPAAWKRPWFASDRWREEAFGSNGKISFQFLDAYDAASSSDEKEM